MTRLWLVKEQDSLQKKPHNLARLKFFFLFFLCLISQKVLANCSEISTQQMASALNANALLQWMSIEAAECRSITLEPDNVAFSLDEQTQKIHNGIRAEVIVDYPFIEGDEVSYTFDVKIPQDFEGDTPQNRWWIIAQWHDQPNPRLNENWKDFPKRSPPVSFFVEEQNGKVGIGLEVRDKLENGQRQKRWFALPLGEWITLKSTMHWSTGEDGWVDFSVSDHPEFNQKIVGSNMHNSFGHYLKIGQYRHPEIKQSNKIYFRNLSIRRN